MFSLPVAVLVCKVVGEPEPCDNGQETALVAEDLPVRVDPESNRIAGERLDRVLMELRKLCDKQRQIVLEEADKGSDCALETQELHRLGELEDELVRELVETQGEVLTPIRRPDECVSALRIMSLQGVIGGGCEAVVEGHKENDPPLQTKIVSMEEVLRDIEEWWNPMLAEYQALVHEKQVVVPVTAKTLAAREEAGEPFQVIPAKLIFTVKDLRACSHLFEAYSPHDTYLRCSMRAQGRWL